MGTSIEDNKKEHADTITPKMKKMLSHRWILVSTSLREVVGGEEPLRVLTLVHRQFVHSVPDNDVLLRCATAMDFSITK
jgi:hypothetical protein